MNLTSLAKDDKAYFPILIIGLIAGYILLYHTIGNGLVMTDDSYKYLEHAKEYAQKKSFSAMGFKTLFPFQTLQIYILYLFGDHWEIGVKFLNYTCWTGTFVIFLKLGANILNKTISMIGFAVLMVFSTPLIMVHSFLWTEPLFIFLLSLQLYMLWLLIKTKRLYFLWPIILLSILYCWQRKAGMLFSLGVLISLVQILVRRRAIRISFYVLITLAIFLLYGAFGIFTNQIGELPNSTGIGTNLYNYFGTLSAWLLPFPINTYLRIIVLIIAMALMSYCFKTIDFCGEVDKKHFIQSIIIIFLLYFIIRHIYHRLHYHEGDRFLAPLYPLFFFFIIFVLERISLLRFSKKLAFTFITVILIWFAYPFIRTIKNADLWHNHSKKSLMIKEAFSKPVKK